jgi:recombination protein RecR
MKIKEIIDLEESLNSLPGVTKKSASKIARYIIDEDIEFSSKLINRIKKAKSAIIKCTLCNDYTTAEICRICKNESRDSSILCIVSEPEALSAIEKSQSYQGKYYITYKEMNPRSSKKMDLSKIRELLDINDVKEIILAFDPTMNGEFTSFFISQELKNLNIKISRIAIGMPINSKVDYADDLTIKMSFNNRKEL